MPTAEFLESFRHARWREYRQVPNQVLAAPWRHWVLAPGSLTKRLILASGGDFRVQVRQQHWARPWPSEQRALGLAPGQLALVREVALLGQGEVWVEARTLIPATTLRGPRRRLANLGTTPLGAYLFKCRSMRRGPLQIAARPAGHDNLAPAWGRRSLFYLAECPLLVSEFFLPALLPHERGSLAPPRQR